MTDPFKRSLPSGVPSGVTVPIRSPTRLLIVDGTRIETRVWPQFNTVDLLIDCRTPTVYTMGWRNTFRLNESIATAVAELGVLEGGH
ncbi:hypothetical protein [Saccharopolyspora phatthalungensis]|uniref:Uncharacterized protein n=1 Tax=Saccharopolyspora phatthalungensis TaxID=664693 RepID=A0A840Q9D6_9PSEU|nr:hypothetical protein [Saccharopolyspora phatthalungensis]MBB5155199.1 hypothetical protein [Saccharopolyspora phatthalungensis]